MDNLVDENTKAILITNPSNPCGSSYSNEHLTNIVAIARYFIFFILIYFFFILFLIHFYYIFLIKLN